MTPIDTTNFAQELPARFAVLVRSHIRPFLNELAHAAEGVLPQCEDQERRTLRGMLSELNQHSGRIEMEWAHRVDELSNEAWSLLQGTQNPTPVRELSLDNLSLIDDSVMQEQVIAWRMASQFEERLHALISSYRGRLATLLNCAEVIADSDPFRPAVLMRALLQATRVLNWGETNWQLLTRLLAVPSKPVRVNLLAAEAAHVGTQQAHALNEVYAAFDQLLEGQGFHSRSGLFTIVQPADPRKAVLEKIDDRLLKENSLLGAARALVAQPSEAAAPKAPVVTASPPDDFPVLHAADEESASPSLPSLASASADPAVVTQALLAAIQRQAKQNEEDRLAGQVDIGLPSLALDPAFGGILATLADEALADIPKSARGEPYAVTYALAALFDYIFILPELCEPVRALLGKLQLPVLYVALTESDFATHDFHPARTLLNQLGEIGFALTVDEYEVESTLGHLAACIDDLAIHPEQAASGLRQAQALVDAWQQVRTVRLQQRLQQIETLVVDDEKQTAAQLAAQLEIEALLARQACPQRLAQFLRDYWVGFIRGQIVGFGVEREDKWRRAVHTAELIVWSVQPKYTWDERKALAEQLPEMLRRFTRGLDILSFTGELRTQILRWLELEHVRAMHGQPIPADELAVPAPPNDNTAEAAERDAWLDSLRLGSWYEVLNEEGEPERYTLAWVSSGHTRLYLATRNALQGRLLTPEEFAHKLRHGAARLLAEGTLIERALQRLFTQLANGEPLSLHSMRPVVAASHGNDGSTPQEWRLADDDDPWHGAE